MTRESAHQHAPGPTIDEVADELIAEGEHLSPVFLDKYDDQALLDALAQNGAIDIKELIRHSARFAELSQTGDIYGPVMEIPESPDNTMWDGQPRRHETGHTIDLDKVRAGGVDPDQVLYFRVTQPSDTPKPEYYWTTDLTEVRNGLNQELGPHAVTAEILVSTLGTIAQNEGLIRDVNDDGGVPVRQIGLAPFDQSGAIAVLNR